jgi:hypothetical protein
VGDDHGWKELGWVEQGVCSPNNSLSENSDRLPGCQRKVVPVVAAVERMGQLIDGVAAIVPEGAGTIDRPAVWNPLKKSPW